MGEPRINENLNASSIEKIAIESMNSKGLTYDSKTGLYYDMENGLYYNDLKKLYFDNENGVYYHYCLNKYTNRYNLRYHSKIKRKKWKKMNELSGNLDPNENVEVTKTSQIISESSQSSSDEDFTEELLKSNQHLTSKYPPCIRVILTESKSENFKIGSLFIIPYTGGIIGNSLKNKQQQNKQNYVIDLKNEENISDIEANIMYDLIDKCYYITGNFYNLDKIYSNLLLKIFLKKIIANYIWTI